MQTSAPRPALAAHRLAPQRGTPSPVLSKVPGKIAPSGFFLTVQDPGKQFALHGTMAGWAGVLRRSCKNVLGLETRPLTPSTDSQNNHDSALSLIKDLPLFTSSVQELAGAEMNEA